MLAIFGALVLLITLIYSNYLAEELKRSEDRNKEIYTMATQELFDVMNSGTADLNRDITFQDSVRNSFPLPIIVEDEMGNLIGNNWPDGKNDDEVFLQKKKQQFIDSNQQPTEGQGYASLIYFFNSPLLDYIKYYPLVQLLLVASFILLGYFVFNTSRKAEQNRVWAGMAKETAHQLGRSPKRVKFDFPDESDIMVSINEHLFDWVIENLMRNSLDAMDGKGTISAKLSATDVDVIIEMSDTGKGIPSSKFQTVFKPGFSTKQRGWGLGLSLAKRIIEEYHKGKIFVKSSKLGEGTTFTIKLPRA